MKNTAIGLVKINIIFPSNKITVLLKFASKRGPSKKAIRNGPLGISSFLKMYPINPKTNTTPTLNKLLSTAKDPIEHMTKMTM